MQYFHYRVLLFLFTAFAENCFSQQLIFKTYGMNDGLVHNVVRKIYQDSKGFLWFGTWEGLSKYDGYRFTNYTSVNGFSNGVTNDIFENSDGSLYVASNNASIYHIRSDGLSQKIGGSTIIVNTLNCLPNNKIIALTDGNGLYEFNEGNLTKPAQARPANNYYNLVSFSDSLLLLQSDYSLQLLNLRYELISEQTEKISVYAECGMLKDSKNRIWIGTNHGLKLLSSRQEKGKPLQFLNLPQEFTNSLLQKERITAMLEDTEGNLWFGTIKGLFKVSAEGVQLITEKNGLPANDVSCLYQDKEKNIWIGGSRGVAKLTTATSIRIFKIESGLTSNSLAHVLPFSNGDVLTVSDVDKQVYKKSTSVFEPATNNVYNVDEKKSASIVTVDDHSYLILQQSASHTLFFSPTSAGGYYAFKDSRGNFFTHSFSGISVSSDLKKWHNALCSYDTRVVMLDSKGVLWAGTRDSGLLRISYEYNNAIPQIKQQAKFLEGIGIRSLYEDSKGNIWAGSRYDGVYLLSKDGNIKQFYQKSGLTSNRITSIAEDKHGAIWLSFYSGLDKLVPENNSYRVFNFSRFHNFFTNIQAMVMDNEYSLWLGTTQGLVNIKDGETENTPPLKTIITSSILGDSVYSASSKKIQLGYRQNSVHFEFSAPAFINENQIMFSYRLLGGIAKWSGPSNEHAVSFASLRPGEYQFEVRTLGWNNQWGEASLVAFTINPPFWQRTWFIIAVALIIASLIFLFVRKRIKNIRSRAELKHKLSDAEMLALRNQMNPHFIFNCLSAIDNLVQTNQADKATTYLSRFAKLMRAILESSKNNLVPFHRDFETLNLFLQLEQFRFNNKFSYELTADDELLQGDFKVPPLIVQPFVENAIHHGLLNKQEGEKKLSVKASLQNNRIHYTIVDNGVGRTRAYEIKTLNKPDHVSYGIQITTERLHLHNQNGKTNDIKITDLIADDKPCGTRVEIQLKTDQ